MKRVLIVEDSPTARRHLAQVLSECEDFELAGQARDGEEAVRAAEALQPDLVTLDVFLPDLTAAEVVRRLQARRPVAVLLLSDAPRDADDVFRALEAGAVDFLPKPRPGDAAGLAAVLAAMREVAAREPPPRPEPSPRAPAEPKVSSLPAVVAVASSTGGPPALRALLAGLGKGFPLPVLVAQHLTPGFEDGLARWLTQTCALPVKVVTGPTKLTPGTVYLGQPGCDLAVRSRTEVTMLPAPARGYHPSADLLFESAAAVFGPAVAVVVLSGIGADGLAGATKVQQAGGVVFAQSLSSALVKGMPQAVIKAAVSSFDATPELLAQRLTFIAAARRP